MVWSLAWRCHAGRSVTNGYSLLVKVVMVGPPAWSASPCARIEEALTVDRRSRAI
jgi:hypothetical protein